MYVRIALYNYIFQGIIVSSYVDMSEPSYGDYVYPRVAIGFGWVLSVSILLPLPICAVRQLLREEGSLKQVMGMVPCLDANET